MRLAGRPRCRGGGFLGLYKNSGSLECVQSFVSFVHCEEIL
jgi:hypothetical protein